MAAAPATIRRLNEAFVVQRVERLTTLEQHAVWERRLWGFVLGAFAVLAVLLTGVGLYGVMSYVVTQRRREMGVRLAIGATRGGIVRLVLGQGLATTAVGLAFGLALALAAGRHLHAVLFGVYSHDRACVRRRCGSARDGCRHRLPGPSLEGIAHRTDRRASGECLTAGTQS